MNKLQIQYVRIILRTIFFGSGFFLVALWVLDYLGNEQVVDPIIGEIPRADTFYDWNNEVPMATQNSMDDKMTEDYTSCLYQDGTFRYFPAMKNDLDKRYECILPEKAIIIK